MTNCLIRIPIDQLDDDLDLSALQKKFSDDFNAGKPLPKDVEVISLEQLLREVNEIDPDFYFKPLLTNS